MDWKKLVQWRAFRPMARVELVKTGENLCKVLPDLDRYHAESTAARLDQRAAAKTCCASLPADPSVYLRGRLASRGMDGACGGGRSSWY